MLVRDLNTLMREHVLMPKFSLSVTTWTARPPVTHSSAARVLAEQLARIRQRVKAVTFSDEWHVRVCSHAAKACHRTAVACRLLETLHYARLSVIARHIWVRLRHATAAALLHSAWTAQVYFISGGINCLASSFAGSVVLRASLNESSW